MYHYVLGVGAMVGLMVVWVLVQMLWMRVFPEYKTDVDALAIREGCHACEHGSSCSIQDTDPCKNPGFEV